MRLVYSFFFVLLLALPACSPPARKCADSCLGCCDLNGQCRTGNSVDFCGGNGSSCRACAQNQVCQINACVLIIGGTGGGVSGTGGGASGGGAAAGGSTAGGSTAGGSTAGGSTAGGSTAGGSTAGGSTAGGSTAGGSTAGGSTAGGSAAGGSAAGGSAAGGSAAGGSAAGGSTGGGSTGGGSTAGGAAAGGSAGGGSAGGSANCGIGPPCVAGKRCVNDVCICDGASCPMGCCSAAGNCVAMALSSCNINGGSCVSCGQTANRCVGGTCQCGTNAACGTGQRCVADQCVCDAVSCPMGCCQGNTCVARSAATCGAPGAACTSCGVGADVCTASGACQCGLNPPCPGGAPCVSGMCGCAPSTCPSGCCQGTSCVTPSTGACGANGATCVACGANADTCSATGACRCGMNPACGAGLSCVSGACQMVPTTWTPRSVTQPTAVYATAVAWDSGRQRLVLFGGRAAAGLAETWELTPSGWTQLTPLTSPPARYGHDMAYDPVRQRVILFGGFPTGGTRLADTWEWDGTNWVPRTPMTSPSARSGHRMAWDPVRNVIVLFGGRIDGTTSFYQSDTWTWSGTNWTLVASTGPTAREGVALAWDPGFTGGRLVLFGGLGAGGNRNDTWVWDGTMWTTVTASASPPGRVFHDMVYSPVLGKVLLFGGSTGGTASATFYGDTWVFDRTTWTQLMPPLAPAARNGHSMEFDQARGRITLISGWNGTTTFGDQWEY